VELVRKWAESNADSLLEKTTKIFSVPHIEGVIGYRTSLGYAIVYGDPVTAPFNKIPLALEFEKFCQSQRLKIIYVVVSEEFAKLAVNNFSFSSIEFGLKFVLDPFKYKKFKTTLLRKKIRQSSNKGVLVSEYTGSIPEIEHAIKDIATEWSQSRKGIQLYLANPVLFTNNLGKRWFYAEQNGKIIGFLLLSHIQAHQGWLISSVMISKQSPSGVSEHLITSALEILEKEQCRFVLIGPVPASELGEIIGLSRTFTSLARLIYKFIKKICRLDGHEIFWGKFEPTLTSSYLLFPKTRFRISGVLSLLHAFNITFR